MDNVKKIQQILINRGRILLNGPRQEIHQFTRDIEADRLLNDLNKYPHAFVLACVMDRQIKAEKAWLIPYKISRLIGGFSFRKLSTLNKKQIADLFERNRLHRFNSLMADNFYYAVRKINDDYNKNAANIWKDKPSSALLVSKFLEFKGVGVKIATMAVNILARDFKIPMKDHICIDISPDVQVKRVFKRIGFIPKNASNEELIYCARDMNPSYPGIFDLSAWEIGRRACRPQHVRCELCYLSKYCPKNI